MIARGDVIGIGNGHLTHLVVENAYRHDSSVDDAMQEEGRRQWNGAIAGAHSLFRTEFLGGQPWSTSVGTVTAGLNNLPGGQLVSCRSERSEGKA